MNTFSKRGISLLEVLMAISLLAVTMASLLSLYFAVGSFYQRLFPLDVASLRDCIEVNELSGSEVYIYLDDEDGWLCSGSIVDNDARYVVKLTQVSSVVSYEFVEVFPIIKKGEEKRVSSVSLLTYIR